MWGSKFNKWKNSGEIFGVTVYLLYICTLDMKEFFKVLRRFVPPYKKYLVLTVLFNILSAILNIFSFAAIIPILNILFKTEDSLRQVEYMPVTMDNLKEAVGNNLNYYMQEWILDIGPTMTLLCIGLFPGLCHVPENRCLLPVVGHHYPHPNGRGARHPQPTLPENHRAAAGILLRGAQGRHHCPHERRRAGDREQYHVVARHAVQEPHSDYRLRCCSSRGS